MDRPRAGGWGVLISAALFGLGMIACTPGGGAGGTAGGGGAGAEGGTTGGGAGGTTSGGAGDSTAGGAGTTGTTGGASAGGSTAGGAGAGGSTTGGAGNTTAGGAGTGGVSGTTGTTGAASGTVEAGEESFEGTSGITDKPKERMKPAILHDVRAGRHSSFDRMTFEFEGQELPGYHLEYIDHPVRQCASGNEVAIAGQGWLLVRMKPAQAHTEAGKPSIPSRTLKPGLDVVKEAALTCDFEGDVTWVLGVSSPNKYRVMELSSPPRLAVDVKH